MPVPRSTAKLAVTVDRAIEKRWPGADARSTELAINLFALTAQVTAFSEALCAKHGVPSPAAFNVLTILEGAGRGMPPSEIADRMIVSRPTITGILDSLTRRRLVRSRKHPTDGRMQLVSISPSGHALVHRMRPELHAAERKWMACLDRTQQDQLAHLIATLQAHAPRLD
jgi:DNA-binding MarR family transcriptional regulator